MFPNDTILDTMAKILLIEDDTCLAATIDEWLRVERHCVEIAYDGKSGWDFLQASKFDLVILDWNLPFTPGIDLCRKFRAVHGSAPIIMLTGRCTISEKEEGLDSGADDYLTKPFSFKELAARIRALLRRPPDLLNGVLTSGDITLDPVKHQVIRGKKEVYILRQDFALLEFLMRNPTQVFSTTTLLHRVWSSDSEAAGDAIRSSIKRLRQKLDDKNANEASSIIENVPKIGYRIRQDYSKHA